MFNKYHLIMHLSAIKKYLLLGQGDFAQHLMDGLTNELTKRARCVHYCCCRGGSCCWWLLVVVVVEVLVMVVVVVVVLVVVV